MQRENVFERRKQDQSSDALTPDQVEGASINELAVELQEYVSTHALRVEAALDKQILTIRKTDNGRRLSVEAVGETFVTFDKSDEVSESSGPFTRDELVDEIHRWLSGFLIGANDEAINPRQNDEEFNTALGRAVVEIWSDIPQDIQRALFTRAAAALEGSKRDDLAIYLHHHHHPDAVS